MDRVEYLDITSDISNSEGGSLFSLENTLLLPVPLPAPQSSARLPHPIPYQGSKRQLAASILAVLGSRKFQTLYEPFAGSAAVTIAATQVKVARDYVLGDNLAALIDLWNQILSSPYTLANEYERLWNGQAQGDEAYYNEVRREFNRSHEPAALLYLLARCVKNALRFNQQGEFNQSHDKRRLGTHPHKMRREILETWSLLSKHTTAVCADCEVSLAEATSEDIVYMDPPLLKPTIM
jgi:DNA adenine methylase